ncbi:hypothetical protein [Burkholderia plantarii]|uniref:hypothetical protein n=1 Tax=Burkholderia plantarii TaxID=41899 RepID=UPI00209B4151|nr:hypothetical protein [Burkholderia plantarii]
MGVHNFPNRGARKEDGGASLVDGGSDGGDDGGMEERIKELEKSNADIRERLARMESGLNHVATKADVASLESTLLKWFVGTAIALAGLAFAAAKLIH